MIFPRASDEVKYMRSVIPFSESRFTAINPNQPVEDRFDVLKMLLDKEIRNVEDEIHVCPCITHSLIV